MKVFVSIILYCSTLLLVNAQTIPNHKFDWSQIGTCLPEGVCNEVYLRAEKDPSINQYTKKEFQYLISNAIKSMKLESNLSGTLKLKLLFLPGQSLCLNEIGSLGIQIPEDKFDAFSNNFKIINQITHAQMKNQPVRSEGLMYLIIKDGKLESMRNVKFNFKQDI